MIAQRPQVFVRKNASPGLNDVVALALQVGSESAGQQRLGSLEIVLRLAEIESACGDQPAAFGHHLGQQFIETLIGGIADDECERLAER